MALSRVVIRLVERLGFVYAGVMSQPAPAPTSFAEAQAVLAATLPNYERRAEQEALASSIERSWSDGSILVGQAGTGTGKSLAALIPAILSGERTVYSTATKALQSQIVGKDLPFLAEHLGVPFRYAMLQGRSNYFCHLQATQEASGNPLVAEVLGHFNADDEDEGPGWPRLNGLREDTPVLVDNKSWSSMTISADECPRKKCPFYSVCRFQEAKSKADQAQVVVANHMLVALDGVVREQSSGYANVLGEYEHIIIDECHELAEYIAMALSTQQSMGTWKAYGTELRSIFRSGEFEPSDLEAAEAYANDAIVAASTFFDTFEEGRVRHGTAVTNADVVTPLIDILASVSEMLAGYDEIEDKGLRARVNRLTSRTDGLHKSLVSFLLSPDSETVRLFEKSFHGNTSTKVLRVILVRVGDWAKEWLWEACVPTMISATVLIDGRPDFIVDQLGLDCAPVSTIDVGSPFDFNRQSRLYVPAHICEPTPAKRLQWEAQMMPLIEEMVKISEGRALLLFTSNKQMQTAWDSFASRIPYPCRKQGDASTALLTTWFREETHSVLFATRSFFTGIDIQGESLSLVVIDKLPFPVPTDPVFEARSEDVERRGKNSFADLTIPMMTLVLQQAFGRLIRTKGDRGVVAIMDPRLKTKGYGAKIMRSLPAPYTDDLNEVERFFAASMAE